MMSPYSFLLIAFGLLPVPAVASAVLETVAPIEQTMVVAQFGVLSDTTFIVCEKDACPKRSIKHLDIPYEVDLEDSSLPDK